MLASTVDPPVCTICGKQFEHRSSLSKHKRVTHDSPGDTHGCHVCGKTFHFASGLSRHWRQVHRSTESPSVAPMVGHFSCDLCGKTYRHPSSLSKHRRLMHAAKPDEDQVVPVLTTASTPTPMASTTSNSNSEHIVMNYLMNENHELKHFLMEQLAEQNRQMLDVLKGNAQQATMQTITNVQHNTTTNSNNKSFNLNFFLNETCKNAMNIMDFADSIQLQLSDLESIGELGYIEGISNIIVQNLRALDITERPIHCTDKKREVLYVKDENKWEKEDTGKSTLRKVIKKVANKNIRLIPQFKEKHPDCGRSDSHYADQYNKIIVESLRSHDEGGEKEEKIIRNITKEVVLDKTSL